MLTKREKEELLRKHAPHLHFSRRLERFLPMPVEPFFRSAVLRLEYRLFGLFQLRGWDVVDFSNPNADHASSMTGQTPETEKTLMPTLNLNLPENLCDYWLVSDIAEPQPLWERISKLPFIKKERSLVYVRDEDMMAWRRRKYREPVPITQRQKFVNRVIMTLMWVVLLVTLVVTFFSDSLLNIGLLFVAVVLLGLFLGRKNRLLGFGLFGIAATRIVSLLIVLMLPVGVYILFLILGYGVGFLLVLAGAIDKFDNVIAFFSPLDDETGDAAFAKYDAQRKEKGFPPTYYGRVWEAPAESEWEYVLQYWMFYCFNDWRTKHRGLDDHEGDWELVQVHLPRDKAKMPHTVYSQHFIAAPKVVDGERIEGYVAAGSHACYHSRDRHPLSVMIAARKSWLSPFTLFAVFLRISEFIRSRLGQTREVIMRREFWADGANVPIETGVQTRIKFLEALPPTELMRELESIPHDSDEYEAILCHIDQRKLIQALGSSGIIYDEAQGGILVAGVYADDELHQVSYDENEYTAEGRFVSEQADYKWQQVLIDEQADWMNFKGRWGKSVFYPPESGPGGPRFNQDGKERLAWADPIAWANIK